MTVQLGALDRSPAAFSWSTPGFSNKRDNASQLRGRHRFHPDRLGCRPATDQAGKRARPVQSGVGAPWAACQHTSYSRCVKEDRCSS
jgi:hypothetical protein